MALCFLRESTVGSVTKLCQVEATESLCSEVMGHSGQRSYADRCLSQGNAIDGTDKAGDSPSRVAGYAGGCGKLKCWL